MNDVHFIRMAFSDWNCDLKCYRYIRCVVYFQISAMFSCFRFVLFCLFSPLTFLQVWRCIFGGTGSTMQKSYFINSCIYIYIYIYVCVCVCVCLYIYIYVYRYVCVFIYICIYICVCVCVRSCVRACVCTWMIVDVLVFLCVYVHKKKTKGTGRFKIDSSTIECTWQRSFLSRSFPNSWIFFVTSHPFMCKLCTIRMNTRKENYYEQELLFPILFKMLRNVFIQKPYKFVAFLF